MSLRAGSDLHPASPLSGWSFSRLVDVLTGRSDLDRARACCYGQGGGRAYAREDFPRAILEDERVFACDA